MQPKTIPDTQQSSGIFCATKKGTKVPLQMLDLACLPVDKLYVPVHAFL